MREIGKVREVREGGTVLRLNMDLCDLGLVSNVTILRLGWIAHRWRSGILRFWATHLKKTFGSMAILEKLFRLLTVLMPIAFFVAFLIPSY